MIDIKNEIIYILANDILKRLLKSDLISEEEYIVANKYSAEYLKAKTIIV